MAGLHTPADRSAQAQEVKQDTDVVGSESSAEVADTASTPVATEEVTKAVSEEVDPSKWVTYPLNIGGWTMQPGEEQTHCILKRLNNPEEIWVNAIHTNLSKGSHHLILYRSNDEVEQPTPFECGAFEGTLADNSGPLMITQLAKDAMQLPPGVAVKFKANQMILVETHYYNTLQKTVEATASVAFQALAKAQVKAEADTLWYGTPAFYLQPGETTQTPWNYLPMKPDTNVFAIAGHTHELGIMVEIGLATGGAVADPVVQYPGKQKYTWSEPPVVYFKPALAFGKNQGFQYRCTWYNYKSKGVGFGITADKEMCFFWAYYYPSTGFRMCINPGPDMRNYAKSKGFEVGNAICCPDDAEQCAMLKLLIGKSK